MNYIERLKAIWSMDTIAAKDRYIAGLKKLHADELADMEAEHRKELEDVARRHKHEIDSLKADLLDGLRSLGASLEQLRT